MRLLKALFPLLFIIFTISSCKKQSESLSLSSLHDYYPLQKGKSLIYRLDSTLYIAFGTTITTNSYLAKDSFVSTFADNEGRTSYLVYRYLTDTLQSQPYTYNSSYYITPTKTSVEVTDANNLRYLKLTQPIAATTLWNGNAYIDASDDNTNYLANWQYQYQSINAPFTVLAGTIDSTITVLGANNPSPVQPFDPSVYQSSLYASEVYAKGIGLIYKDLSYWVWQPIGTITPGYTAQSFGIRLNLISYR